MNRSALELLETPFIFSQHGPLTTKTLIDEARLRGVRLDTDSLQTLHERAGLSPLAVVTDSPVRHPCAPITESPVGDSRRNDLRQAQLTGSVLDPNLDSLGPTEPLTLREAITTDSHRWWNGAIYSRWQLLHADELRRWLGPTADTPSWVEEQNRKLAARRRLLALRLTVLEARYLPQLEHGWLVLRGVDHDEWATWRDEFDAAAMLDALDVTPDGVVQDAESLLMHARKVDPTGRWSELIRRAPVDSWRSLRGDALIAMDSRVAAEVLLLFHEDLVAGGRATALEAPSKHFWHFRHERLSSHRETLDQTLTHLGVSPHPGAILLIEGETERRLVPKVFEHLGMSTAPDLVQVAAMNGVDKDLTMLATALIAPLLGEGRPNSYELLRPPCHLIVAVDPEGRWRTDESTERHRGRLVRAVGDVVQAQAPDADVSLLDDFIEVRRWDARCFEYAHFDDNDLFEAITAVHLRRETRPPDEEVRAAIASARRNGHDISAVWREWDYHPPKPELADALWPALRRRIGAAKEGHGEVPQVVTVVQHAYAIAQQYSRHSWVIGRISAGSDGE
jgi:hypothetical protein